MDCSAIHINAATSVGNLSIDSTPERGMTSTLKVLSPSKMSLYSVMPQYGMELARLHPSSSRKMLSGVQPTPTARRQADTHHAGQGGSRHAFGNRPTAGYAMGPCASQAGCRC